MAGENKPYELMDATAYTEEQLREIWNEEYVCQRICTHDGILVKFYDSNFDHAFYDSSKRRVSKKDPHYKDTLSEERVERLRWIKDVLTDTTAQLKMGYDNKKKKYDYSKRVALVKGNYVVIIQLYGDCTRANFITAFVADDETVEKIENDIDWV